MAGKKTRRVSRAGSQQPPPAAAAPSMASAAPSSSGPTPAFNLPVNGNNDGEDVMEEDPSWQPHGPGVDDEVRAIEKVINAFQFYKRYCRQRVFATISNMRRLPLHHQNLVGPNHSEHTRRVMDCIDINYEVLKQMLNLCAGMFGREMEQALRITQLRKPQPSFMSKVHSCIRQIVREWSLEGKPDRDVTFQPILDEMERRFPDKKTRPSIKLLLPGAGAGRLPFELVTRGFSVTGNELSLFMLMPSCFMLNNSRRVDQYTIYPFLFEKSNSWSYEDMTRPVHFPDVCPGEVELMRPNLFSMCAGDMMDVTADADCRWHGVATSWFIDTANNIIDYIDRIFRVLKPGGVWVNVGPLTYHYEDMDDEFSIELPYSEVRRLILERGFRLDEERQVESNYTVNRRSMLRNQYTCAYFVATKPAIPTSVLPQNEPAPSTSGM